MVSATLTHDTLLPRAPGGQGLGAVLSLAAHGLLLAGMVTVVQWRTQAPEVVIAELWSGVPEAAAPPAVEAPPPVPRVAPEPAPPPPAPTPAEPPPLKVDIATERAEKERAERERREAEAARRKQEAEKARAETEKLKRGEAERKAREKREKREEADAAARLQQQREANLARMLAQAGTGTGTGTGTGSAASAPGPGAPEVRGAAPSASYKARLVAVIRSNLTFGGDVPGNPVAEVRVRATASGTILSRVLVKSSGHAAWDNAVLAAIDKTGTLPRDTDGRVPSEMIVAFRPKE